MSHLVKSIIYVVKIVCCVPTVLVLPRFVEFLLLAPKTAFDSVGSQTTMQLLGIAGFIAGGWVALFWTIYFGWRTIRTWRRASCGPALMMALPSFLVLALAFVAMSGAG